MKKSNRNVLIVLAGILAGIGLFFFFRTADNGDTNTEEDQELTTKVNAEDLLEGVEPEDTERIKDLPQSFFTSNAEFSLELFKELAAEENAVFSPVPVYLSLALVSNGAEDEASSEILDTLNLTDLSDEEFNSYHHELINILKAEDANADLNISNSIWYDEDFQANADFLQTNKTYYDADSYTIDFSDSKSPNEMNDWVSEATNGKIEKMVDEIGSDAVMYLFSTIYFDGKWEMPFEAQHSYESDFLVEGETRQVEKMTGRFDIESIITEEEEGIVLPYEDNEYSFLALMPAEGVDVREYLQSFDEAKLNEIYNKATGGNSMVHKYHVLRKDLPSTTILAHLYKDGLRFIHYDPEQARSLTIREAARLQGFPDDFEFIAARGHQYKMIGNAVPPIFSKILAESLHEFMNKDYNK